MNRPRTSADCDIMVFDDCEDLLDLYDELLTDDGYRVVTAGLGKTHMSAFRSVLAHMPRLIILDLMYGYKPIGAELFTSLRRHRLTRELPVIVCTADVLVLEKLNTILIPGTSAVLMKPFDIDEVSTLVRDMIGGTQRYVPITFQAMSTVPSQPSA